MALPIKMTKVFEKYEALDPSSWIMGDFEQDIIAVSGKLANYQNAKSAIRRAKDAGLFPITVNAYEKKHFEVFKSYP